MSSHLDRENWVIVLKAYLDDSGSTGDQPAVIIAGFLADDLSWSDFETIWGAFLDRHDLRKGGFHAAEFWARKSRPYCNWNSAKHAQVEAEVIAILRDSPGLLGIATGVALEAYQAYWGSTELRLSKDPYYFCLDRSLRALIRGVKRTPIDDGIAVYIDQDKGRERFGLELAEWHEQRVRKGEVNALVDKDRPVSTHYVDKRLYLPLQLADIYANALCARYRGFLQTCGWPAPNPFLQAILDSRSGSADALFHSAQMIDIEVRTQISGAFPWPAPKPRLTYANTDFGADIEGSDS